LHTRGIVHRDLKPSNILLDDQGWPYVTDFGLVKVLAGGSDLTGSGAVVGTPSYMAPEQAAGRNAEVGPLSDVYSVGAMLYEMLVGQAPFNEATPFETLVQVLEGEPPLPRSLNPTVPPELEMVCLKAMAKLPEERYASAAALAEDLERFLRSEPVLARPHSPRQRLFRWARQEPGLASRLGALAAGAIIAQVYYHLAHPVSLLLHTAIVGVLGLWALASIVCQTLIRRGLWPEAVRVAWLAVDALMLTSALVMDEAFHSPLVLAYGVYIVASGLWFRAGLVWLTTALAAIGYLVLVGVGAARAGLGESPQHHLIVLISLVLLGVMVAAQVKRVRALSRFYERRPTP
jgi:serine/threonine-protein kinase